MIHDPSSIIHHPSSHSCSVVVIIIQILFIIPTYPTLPPFPTSYESRCISFYDITLTLLIRNGSRPREKKKTENAKILINEIKGKNHWHRLISLRFVYVLLELVEAAPFPEVPIAIFPLGVISMHTRLHPFMLYWIYLINGFSWLHFHAWRQRGFATLNRFPCFCPNAGGAYEVILWFHPSLSIMS